MILLQKKLNQFLNTYALLKKYFSWCLYNKLTILSHPNIIYKEVQMLISDAKHFLHF
jgi:hypothetical protein